MDHHPLHLQVTLQEPLLLIHQELQDHLTQLDQLIPLPLLIPLLLLIPLALPLHTHHLLLILLEPQGRIKDHLTIKDLLTQLDLLLLTLQDHHQLIHQEQLTLQALLLLIRQDLTHHHLLLLTHRHLLLLTHRQVHQSFLLLLLQLPVPNHNQLVARLPFNHWSQMQIQFKLVPETASLTNTITATSVFVRWAM